MSPTKVFALFNEFETTTDTRREAQIYNQLKNNSIRNKKQACNNLYQATKLNKKISTTKKRKKDKINPIPENVVQDIINVKKEDKNYIVTNRVAFKKIIKTTRIETGELFMDILNDAISRTNKIVFHTYNFIKLYFIYLVDTDKPFPIINKGFIQKIVNIITYRNQTCGGKPTIDSSTRRIERFYNEHYKLLLNKNDIICRDGLGYVLHYEKTDIITNISNNVKCHYIKHLEKYIWKYYDFSEQIRIIRDNNNISKEDKKNQISKIKETSKNIVNDVLDVSKNKYVSEKMYHSKIMKWKKMFVPNKKKFKKNKTTEDKNIVRYDIACSPFDYLKNMILLSKEYEKFNNRILENYDDKKSKYPKTLKLFNSLPLRTSLIPSSITLDTAGMISLFIYTGSGELLSAVSENGDEVFGRFFNLNSKPFKRKDYIFNNMIRTDGISCSINLVKKDKKGRRPPKKMSSEIKKLQPKNEVRYIHTVEVTDKMKKKEIVTLDPGKRDIISCMKRNNPEMILKTSAKKKSKLPLRNHLKYIHYTYTIGKRNIDIKKKKYATIREKLSKNIIGKRVRVKDLERELSEVNSKTSNLNEFKKYLKLKIRMNNLLYDHYNNPLFRKLNWNTYINTKRSESIMINNFRKIMGPPKKIIVVVGDYSDQGVKGTEPAITKKIRKIFKNNGYETYLIDEFRTSIICSRKNCYGYCEHLKTDKGKELWKVLKCVKCGTIHNRDHNATKNMMKIVQNHFKGKPRPSAMTRPKIDVKNKPKKKTDSKTGNGKKKKKKKIKDEKSISVNNTISVKKITKKSQGSKSTISGCKKVINTKGTIKRNTDNFHIKSTNENNIRKKPVKDMRKIIEI